jgi:hypothetical protein
LPALVDRQTWERVQAKLAQRQGRTTSHKGKNMDKYILSGVVYCAHCGAKMYGQRSTRRKKGKTYAYERYVCSSYHTKGHGVWGHHTIDQAALLAVLLGKLREAVLLGGHRQEPRQRILEGLKAKQSDPADIDALRSRLAVLNKQVDHGAKRLLGAPDDIADLLAVELSKLRKQRDRLAMEVSEREPAITIRAVPVPVTDVQPTPSKSITIGAVIRYTSRGKSTSPIPASTALCSAAVSSALPSPIAPKWPTVSPPARTGCNRDAGSSAPMRHASTITTPSGSQRFSNTSCHTP